MAIPADRVRTPEKSEFSFYEATPGHPAALHTWFYPGNENGFEFVRPKNTVAAGSGAAVAATKSSPMRSPRNTASAKSVEGGS